MDELVSERDGLWAGEGCIGENGGFWTDGDSGLCRFGPCIRAYGRSDQLITRTRFDGEGICIDVGGFEHFEEVELVDGFSVSVFHVDEIAFNVVKEDIVKDLHSHRTGGLHDGLDLVNFAFTDQVGDPVCDEKDLHRCDTTPCFLFEQGLGDDGLE